MFQTAGSEAAYAAECRRAGEAILDGRPPAAQADRYQQARAAAAADVGHDKWDKLQPAEQTQHVRRHLPPPDAQAAADLANFSRHTGAAGGKADPDAGDGGDFIARHLERANNPDRLDLSSTIRPMTPEERQQMAARKKLRRDGKPRVINKHPMRSFRAPDEIWNVASEHAKAKGQPVSEWLRHAITRHAGEEDRQAEYAKKKNGNKKHTPAAAAAAEPLAQVVTTDVNRRPLKGKKGKAR